jgi:hypothetical protein
MSGRYVRTIGMARATAKIGMETLAYTISRFTFPMRSAAADAIAVSCWRKPALGRRKLAKNTEKGAQTPQKTSCLLSPACFCLFSIP